MQNELTNSDRCQICEILDHRANEIAGFANKYRNQPDCIGGVLFAVSREVDRLRRLSDRVAPIETEEADA